MNSICGYCNLKMDPSNHSKEICQATQQISAKCNTALMDIQNCYIERFNVVNENFNAVKVDISKQQCANQATWDRLDAVIKQFSCSVHTTDVRIDKVSDNLENYKHAVSSRFAFLDNLIINLNKRVNENVKASEPGDCIACSLNEPCNIGHVKEDKVKPKFWFDIATNLKRRNSRLRAQIQELEEIIKIHEKSIKGMSKRLSEIDATYDCGKYYA